MNSKDNLLLCVRGNMKIPFSISWNNTTALESVLKQQTTVDWETEAAVELTPPREGLGA